MYDIKIHFIILGDKQVKFKNFDKEDEQTKLESKVRVKESVAEPVIDKG